MRLAKLGLRAALCSLVAVSAVSAEPYPIAGLTPSQRPAGAPTITEFVKTAGWYAVALYGVDAPFPASLRFLEDQGAWFSPFVHPGMLGPYDIRHWHKTE